MATAAPSGTKQRLVALLRERSFERRRVVLASGKESDFFIDCKQTVLSAEGHALAGEVLFDALGELPACDAIAGVELGGCPLASAVSLLSYQRGRPLPALYVRKQAKDHGSRRLVEGGTALGPGARAVLLEDVVTTGGSSLRAVEALRQSGIEVVGVAALVDRLEGGAEAIRAAGLALWALSDRRDYLGDELERLRRWPGPGACCVFSLRPTAVGLAHKASPAPGPGHLRNRSELLSRRA
jgi:orotate phosphoribosyltransferase